MNKKINYGEVACETIRLMRGAKSQAWMTKKFGEKGNWYYRLENGITKISWKQFLEIAKFAKIDAASAILHHINYSKPLEDEMSLWSFLTSKVIPSELIQLLGISETHLERILKGKAETSTEMVFAAIDFSSQALLNILEMMIDITKLQCISGRVQYFLQIRELIENHPNVGALLSILHLDKYKALPVHSDKFFADIFQESEEKIIFYLNSLKKLKVIKKLKNHYVFSPQERYLSLKGKDVSKQKIMLTHWDKFCFEKLNASKLPFQDGNYCNVQVYISDGDTDEQVLKLTRDYLKNLQLLFSKNTRKPHHLKVLSINIQNLVVHSD